MAQLETEGISLHYETLGERGRPPVLLVAGLGGAGRTFGPLVERFAREHFVILPDQRGTGRSSRAPDGYTTSQLARDLASLVASLEVGPVHVVGTSTGGAIAQWMALEHPARVKSVTLASSFARFDAFMRREFALRRKLLAEADLETVYSAYALFLFAPRYAREHPEAVQAWVDRCTAAPAEREVALKRIDMIVAHDTLAWLGEVRAPALVLCGDQDFCTPLPLSEELAARIPGAELRVIAGGGHMIHHEHEDAFFAAVRDFIRRGEEAGP